MVDIDDGSRCQLADECENCATRDDLELVTVMTPVGVYCATLCASCIDHDLIPSPGGVVGAVHRTADHCAHLGITVDDMGAAIEAGNN